MNVLLEKLGIDWKLFLAQAANFLLLLIMLRIFAYKPLLELMKKRKQTIEEGLTKAKEADTRLEEVDKIAAHKMRETESASVAMMKEGADIIDVGGESTRPVAAAVSEKEELARVIPVVEELAKQAKVSIDTRKRSVAETAINAGAQIVNDVSASLFNAVADANLNSNKEISWIAMHMKGDPQTMQRAPHYQDVVSEVREFLLERIEKSHQAGVTDVWIDPGIGFGKSVEHNLLLLRELKALVSTCSPVVIGASRKSFLGAITNNAPVDDRLEASLTCAVWCAQQGVAVVRVHDVAETVDALESWAALSRKTANVG